MNFTESYCELPENIQHILVALDASQSSRRAVRYVANFLRGNPKVFITLLHLSTPEEWQHREGNTGDTAREKARFDMEKELTNDRQILLDAGLKKEQIKIRLMEKNDDSITEGILAQQRELKACTIVVGRKHISKREELLFGSIANRLSHKAEHCAIWIVE
jgi:nucleotide-binding universal stress UspA family protein